MEDPEGLREEIGRCMACRLCFDVCPIYAESQDEKDSPMYRLLTIRRIIDGEEIDDEMRRILESCTLCGDCDATCADEIPITEAIREARAELKSRDA